MRRGTKAGLWALGVVVLFGAMMIPTLLLTLVWPGEARLLAPVLCDDARPDAFIVTDTYSSGTGETSTNFTMYCVGERGDFDDVGWAKPFMLLSTIHTVLIVALVAALLLRRRQRRRRPRPGDVVTTS